MVRFFNAYESMTMTELLGHTDSYVQRFDVVAYQSKGKINKRIYIAVEACEARHPHA